jgi:hypothetical protein
MLLSAKYVVTCFAYEHRSAPFEGYGLILTLLY